MTPVDTTTQVVKNHHIIGGTMTLSRNPEDTNPAVVKFGLFFIGQDDEKREGHEKLFAAMNFDEVITPEGMESRSNGNPGLSNTYPLAESKARLVEIMEDTLGTQKPVTLDFYRFEKNADMVSWMLEK